MNAPSAAIVLAAGAGTRMASHLPKPLHPVGGRAMVLRVLDTLADADAGPVVVVVGHDARKMRDEVHAGAPQPERLLFADQPQQLGTGDAARVGLDALGEHPDAGDVLVLPGDTPLLRAAALRRLVSARRDSGAAASLLSAHLDDPTGYGRIVRGVDGITIVEHRDASAAQARISEINVGVYCFDLGMLRRVLPQLHRDNSAAEFHLTDAVGLVARSGQEVVAVLLDDPAEAMGVNDADQLAACEAVLAARA